MWGGLVELCVGRVGRAVCGEGRVMQLCPHLQLKVKQDEERKNLVVSKDKIREAMGMFGGKLQGPTQVDPSLCTGMTEKVGYLCKKPENTLRLPRRQWPKRYCTVSMQGFTLANSHVSSLFGSRLECSLPLLVRS